ncbi:uncharacterized protein LOC134206445 [Armigeres subalbatus]|uniref:uncharacterized protein LOC134206445 n=1 Tax=Armigeres subalbatus TaxID=124917 RepID=UPI002ED5D4DC
MEKLKQLIHQRGQVKSRLTTIVHKLDEASDKPETTNLSQLKAYEIKLELLYSEYSTRHDSVMNMCTGEQLDAQDSKLEEFDELHTSALVKLTQLMDFFRASPKTVGAPQVIVTQQPLKMPIPTFDGSYEGWPKFKALFNDLIGKCGDSDATKLQYLDKALIGEASGILDARIINNNNYEQAWQLLKDRFENPRVIIDTHITGLLTMSPIVKQSYKELRSLIDTCNRHVEGLRFMDQEVDGTAGLIVVKLLSLCLDCETRKQWEQTMDHAQLKLSDELPQLYETQFGWVMAGALEESHDEVVNVMCVNNEDPLLKSVQRFFEQEELPEEKELTCEEQRIEDHFCKTYQRDGEGRFIVQLPFRDSIDQLGDSRSLAFKRFLSSEKRISNDIEMKRMYQDFLKEYVDLGHCHEIREEDDAPGQRNYYFPHHAVLKPSSTSTKLRVVFDGKAKSNGLSLNEVLMVGPKIQNDLFSIVLRFRTHVYAFSADIEKMYRQVKIDPNQTRYQRIFWREQPKDPIKVLELSTVTYGTSSASFLAVRSMIQLARDESNTFPAAAEVILEDCYMDDVLSGASTLESAKQLRNDIEGLLKKGMFPIRKWCSNDDEVLEGVPYRDREQLVRIEEASTIDTIRSLGILWNPRSDQFLFWRNPDLVQLDEKVTKRSVLSHIAKLFDPLGLISPVIVLAKSIMQQLWANSLEWDEPIEGELLNKWLVFQRSLMQLNEIEIPRCVVAREACRIEIHGFSDASCTAYGSCLYLRSIREDGAVSVKLLCSKSRIAPLHRSTMPRLELCAAVNLARLINTVIPILKMDVHGVKLWCDSQIVLAWIKKNPEQLQIYVRNRVVEINKLTSVYEWNYIKSEDNPADLVSRGCYPDCLRSSDFWWNGPMFLQDTNYMIQETPMINDDELPEMRNIRVCTPAVEIEDEPIFDRCGNFSKLQRILAQVVRFTRLVRMNAKDRQRYRWISVPDMRKAMEYIVRVLQRRELCEEIQCVQRKELSKRLASLQPFLDNEGLLRVGGRLQNSTLAFDAKHQILLPRNHRVTEMLIRKYHEERLHEGPSGLLAAIRQRFWIINARSAIRKVTRSCVRCFKANPKGYQPIMGNLPEERVNVAAAFELTGVDYAGPVIVKEGKYRAKKVKAYIALFVCLTTKSIHLELVSDLTTEAFLGALDRFVNRRGMVRKIISDNATNFVGASRELHQLFLMFRDETENTKINNFLLKREIEWEFIPPRSPNFGGLWEAGVKTVKSHLNRTLGNAILTFEEFATVLTYVEAIVNSRPLYTLSDDPNEPLPITPAHLMLGRPLEAIPKPSYTDVAVNRLSRFQYLNHLRDLFWKSWSRNYLSTLQTRAKWTKSVQNLKMGTIVLLMDDNQPVQTWKMGQIVALYPGKDSVIRVADVKTTSGVFRRSIRKWHLFRLLTTKLRRFSIWNDIPTCGSMYAMEAFSRFIGSQ